MQTSTACNPEPDSQSIFMALASFGDENHESSMLRGALEDRGAIVHDWPLTAEIASGFPLPHTDVLVVAARVLDARVSALIRKVGALPAPYLIVLSETGDVVDRIVALELGADDFLRRDSDPREILARARSLIRRGAQRDGGPASTSPQDAAPWVLNDVNRLLKSPTGTVCELSKGDLNLIDALVDGPTDVFSVDKDSARANSLRVSISRLRCKFRKISSEDLPIRNIWGLGYAFDAPLQRVTSRT